jgi:ADP-ribose pyrophosphatase YjhB (NUDIX family)
VETSPTVSLNPSLEDVHYCPRCASPAQVAFPRSITCPACGYGAYYNPKPVASAIPRTPDGRIILLRRGFDPGAGLWTFPGGFVDLGETIEEAAHRETREELELDITLGPLIGVYSRASERVVLIVYAATADGKPRTTPEATQVEPFRPHDIPWHELAFWSTEQALRDLLARPELFQ